MMNRAYNFLAFLAVVMAAPIHATQQALPDGGVVQPARPRSDADNSANMLESSLGEQPALTASDDSTGTAPFAPGPLEPVASSNAPSALAPAQNAQAQLELPDLRHIEGSPRPGIQVMPAYSVSAVRVPEFRERDLYTKDGMEDLSFKRHPGLLVGNQFNLNRDAAYEMFLADTWRTTKSDYRDMARAMAMGGDQYEARVIMTDITAEDLLMRSEAETDLDQPSSSQFRMEQLGGDSHLTELPAIPVDVTVVRVKW